ncbi:ABC transporter permease [Candidatus Protochlamydia phocaeensis]|uniref:ABC transporter permease n=1 Tax=Candidatus Protochlamydia phocaeensis TaxID=1414722 RepID=UPI0008382BDC|nr:ABC transporter permease [Candidatus Protochlamydia phocaeensis]
MKKKTAHLTYWQIIWRQFRHHYLGLFALYAIFLFALAGIYAPFLASSKPLIVQYDGVWYFPLFRYLFFTGFFTKGLDIFYNLLIFTFPLLFAAWFILKSYPTRRFFAICFLLIAHLFLFIYLFYRAPQDPAANPALNQAKQRDIQSQLQAEKNNPLFIFPSLTWEQELSYMTPYAKLNLALRYQQRKAQQERLAPYAEAYAGNAKRKGKKELSMPTLWQLDRNQERQRIASYKHIIDQHEDAYKQAKQTLALYREKCQKDLVPASSKPIECDVLQKLPQEDKTRLLQARQLVKDVESAQTHLAYIRDRQEWLEQQQSKLKYEIMPLLRPFHWEDDAGGEQDLNRYISWWELTRINRKDMVAALIFGIRVSLSVGLLAIGLALLIGVPIGAMAGYYGGKIDILTYRLIEIWESMPTFFMLLMIVAFLQSKSIFLVIAIIGLFGWTGFSRFVRGEFFRQKQLPYVEACKAQGFNDRFIMFSHLLPNAIPPLLTLVPFAIMGAITSEAGLSFLGLGEEGSSSWGVLMDEGRSAFPSESYLLWPPAILLTLLLVSIALVGDTLRDALDPKLRH